jgi:hypothetical protein
MEKSTSHKTHKSNSFDGSEPKWSWADPIENTGPGSYNIPSFVRGEKALSKTIGKA